MQIKPKHSNTILLPRGFSTQDSLVEYSSKTRVTPQDHDSIIELKSFNKDYKQAYLQDTDFQYESQNTNSLNSLKNKINRWLSKLFIPDNIDSKTTEAFLILLRIIGVIFIGLIVFYIYKAVRQKDIYWLFKKQSKNFTLNLKNIEDNIDIVDFSQLISQSIDKQNYGLAIRLYYLWTLKHLSEKGHITWDKKKTNKDYIQQITLPWLQKDFSKASYLYNNIWYGQHSIDLQQFKQAKALFETILKSDQL